jgi:hypothetical protein
MEDFKLFLRFDALGRRRPAETDGESDHRACDQA